MTLENMWSIGEVSANASVKFCLWFDVSDVELNISASSSHMHVIIYVSINLAEKTCLLWLYKEQLQSLNKNGFKCKHFLVIFSLFSSTLSLYVKFALIETKAHA